MKTTCHMNRGHDARIQIQKGKAKKVRLVLMRQEFVMALFDWVQNHSVQVMQKRLFVFQAIIELLERESQEKFTELSEAEAQAVIEAVKKMDVVESRIPEEKLKRSLDDKGSLIN